MEVGADAWEWQFCVEEWAEIRRYFNGLYVGEYENGRKHGTGKFVYGDGRVYEGEWKDGKQNGNGRLLREDGEVVF